MTGSLAGAYSPGTSVLHRAPAGAKLVALLVASTALLAVRSATGVGVALAVVVALYALARVPWRLAWGQVRPVRLVLVVLLAVQWWLAGPTTAVVTCTRLLVLVALAGLVMLTTRTSALLAAFEAAARPAARVGVDPTRVGLVLALTIRSVPVLVDLVGRVRDAQRARGRENDLRALAVPVVVGALRQADALGEALVARGLDD
ncbi:biotin transport system permease protein [Sediminihabitans luteus]|uniref:Biotin transport system permease protein n=1 Tax=Sediminihabitans luteus TaxID=1138585 RepID=A0A2M9CYE7_9CELL|nr:energy-coupling factor transporter transmembrane protein EcfT [Sediminihabitans luteus]PJJ76873.1 biotin transport system permease protein [Sediminihabitans luteus]GIJ00354.1 cobalt ABC transporter permease [Sediminihabitans luteus]